MLSFPRGRSGLGLLILRLTAAALILTIADRDLVNDQASLLSLVVAVVAIFMALGLFTTACSGLAAFLAGALFFSARDGQGQLIVTSALLCISLAMVGAGAYSLDALLFGHRRVTFSNR